MKRLTRILLTLFAALSLLISAAAWAAAANCGVCGMMIPDHAKNHITMQATGDAQPLHICSVGCLKKAKKNGKSGAVQFADFNNPDSFIAGEKAHFLVGATKIKADIGEMAMPPFVGAFATKKDADAAKAKYGEGTVVQGMDAALK